VKAKRRRVSYVGKVCHDKDDKRHGADGYWYLKVEPPGIAPHMMKVGIGPARLTITPLARRKRPSTRKAVR
jgi:hypothetical protein